MARFEVPWTVGDALVVFTLSWMVLPLAVVMGLIFFAGQLSWAQSFLTKLRDGDIEANFVLVVLNGLAAVALVGYYLRRYHRNWRDVGLRSFSLVRAIFYLVAIFAGFLMLVAGAYALISWLVPSFNPSQAQTNEFTRAASPETRRISFLALVVIPPIIEEIVFRGFLFPALSKRLGIFVGAIVTSLLFGLAHWQLNVSIYTLVLSLLLCLLYYKLRSIWPGIFFHALNNYLAFVALAHK